MLFLVLFSLLCFNPSLSLRICSFNVRSFGAAKIARAEVLDAVVKVRLWLGGTDVELSVGFSSVLSCASSLCSYLNFK